MTRTRSALAIVGWVGFVVAVSVLLAEALLPRRRAEEIPVNNVPYPYVMFRPPANITWQSAGPSPSARNGDPAIEYSTSDAFRVDAPDYVLNRVKPDGQIRIAVLGGSTVRVGTTFDVTLPGALRTTLRARYPGTSIEVINAGIIGAISRQELIFLITTVIDYAPDLLVIYDGINDSGQMLYYENRPNYPYNYRAVEASWRQYVAQRSEPLWKLALQRSVLLERVWSQQFGAQNVLETIRPEQLIENAALRGSFATAHTDNWDKMWRISTAFGSRSAFVLQPTSLYATAAGSGFEGKPPALYANYLVYEDMRRAGLELAGRNPGLRVLDLSSLLPADAFYDGAHVYDEANTLIAERLATFLASDIEALQRTRARPK